MNRTRLVAGVAFGLFALYLLWPVLTERPSTDREWVPEQARQATVDITGNTVTVTDVRDARWETTTQGDISWITKTYELDSLEQVWFVVEPISNWDGMAHTLYSFQFGDEFLTLSVEARKEPGEPYGAVAGMRRKFELIYILATEDDVLGLRAVQRNHSVYLYPVNTTPQRAQELFRAVADRANSLSEEPEFYHSLFSTCTTNVVDHINEMLPGRVPRWSPRVLMPGYSDALAYELGIIDTSVPLEELRAQYDIADRIRTHTGEVPFSQWIRS